MSGIWANALSAGAAVSAVFALWAAAEIADRRWGRAKWPPPGAGPRPGSEEPAPGEAPAGGP